MIELLVVLLVIGALLNIALPSYMVSMRSAREKTANSNAKMVATAIQSLYSVSGGIAYNHVSITDGKITTELGGRVPLNPCTGGTNLATDYTVSLSATFATVKARAGTNCDAGSLPTYKLLGA
jgi:type II secretory pathway pseudopilin PulG